MKAVLLAALFVSLLATAFLVSGCGLLSADQLQRLNAASQAGLGGVNEFYAAHPPLVLPPSQCYGCRR